MTKKEKFINFIEKEIFNNDCVADAYLESYEEDWSDIVSFWNDYKKGAKKPEAITENGMKIITFMNENFETMNNMFTSKEIALGIFTSSRSVAGSMRKLFNDGYVDKKGKDPIQYCLTEAGMNLFNKN